MPTEIPAAPPSSIAMRVMPFGEIPLPSTSSHRGRMIQLKKLFRKLPIRIDRPRASSSRSCRTPQIALRTENTAKPMNQ